MQAFVFIKPHAVTPAVQALAKSKLQAAGITVVKEGTLHGREIESKKLIDNHYYASEWWPNPRLRRAWRGLEGGAWRVVLGVWCLECGAWSVVLGGW